MTDTGLSLSHIAQKFITIVYGLPGLGNTKCAVKLIQQFCTTRSGSQVIVFTQHPAPWYDEVLTKPCIKIVNPAEILPGTLETLMNGQNTNNLVILEQDISSTAAWAEFCDQCTMLAARRFGSLIIIDQTPRPIWFRPWITPDAVIQSQQLGMTVASVENKTEVSARELNLQADIGGYGAIWIHGRTGSGKTSLAKQLVLDYTNQFPNHHTLCTVLSNCAGHVIAWKGIARVMGSEQFQPVSHTIYVIESDVVNSVLVQRLLYNRRPLQASVIILSSTEPDPCFRPNLTAVLTMKEYGQAQVQLVSDDVRQVYQQITYTVTKMEEYTSTTGGAAFNQKVRLGGAYWVMGSMFPERDTLELAQGLSRTGIPIRFVSSAQESEMLDKELCERQCLGPTKQQPLIVIVSPTLQRESIESMLRWVCGRLHFDITIFVAEPYSPESEHEWAVYRNKLLAQHFIHKINTSQE